jgi:hypothetical protein
MRVRAMRQVRKRTALITNCLRVTFFLFAVLLCSAMLTFAGLYTEPASGACTNATDPDSRFCAYGGGEQCDLCPSQGLCPGGFRIWPRPGYWIPSERSSAAELVPCPPPATSRCVSWDTSSGSVTCGYGYRAQSLTCSSCAQGFYEQGGRCVTCPARRTTWEIFQGLLELVLFVFGAIALVYASLLAVVRCWGGTLRGAAKRAFELTVW